VLKGRRLLAVVPARAGSKGIPDKNMRQVAGSTLIARAGRILGQLDFLDARIISTDSPTYAEEGRRHGLDAPFMRPAALSDDSASAIETLQHALVEAERAYRAPFDVVLIIEPTSPLRRAEDIAAASSLLIESGADSVVSVSAVDTRFNPRKVLTLSAGRLGFFAEGGARVVNRQELGERLYWRNGICYALTRDCLITKSTIFTDHTLPLVIDRPVVNVDDPIDLELAEFFLARDRT
jgi:CMP-N,N'-diacetyllegionaminic acid synthase